MGLFAEIGPRALGHRSILADPTKPEMLEFVSQRLKNREFYRPLAPIVTDREFPNLFTGPQGKYMQFRNIATPYGEQKVPAVVARDKSTRAQVVTAQDDPWLYELLVAFGQRSGVECLINTSLNARGRPICETLDEAIFQFRWCSKKVVTRDGFGIQIVSLAEPQLVEPQDVSLVEPKHKLFI